MKYAVTSRPFSKWDQVYSYDKCYETPSHRGFFFFPLNFWWKGSSKLSVPVGTCWERCGEGGIPQKSTDDEWKNIHPMISMTWLTSCNYNHGTKRLTHWVHVASLTRFQSDTVLVRPHKFPLPRGAPVRKWVYMRRSEKGMHHFQTRSCRIPPL